MNNEILPTDQDENDQKFAEIFGRLGRIECPPDFTVRTRARIAAARPQPRNSILMPVLRYSIPLSLILGIFAVFAVNRLTQPELASVEQIIVDRPVSNAASEPVIAPREAALAQNETTPVSEPPSIAAKRIEPVRPAESVQTSDEAGSIVRSLRGRRPSILPRGLDPTPGTETAPAANNNASALSAAGIVGEPRPNGFLVTAVAADSRAARGGLRTGDIIESINGEPIRNAAALPPLGQLRSITVRRGTESIVISLNQR